MTTLTASLPKSAVVRDISMASLELFAVLQLLDFSTTLIGLRLGAQEASPFVRTLIQIHPLAGLAISKSLAFVLAGTSLWLNKSRVIRWMNYWFAALVLWNIKVILITAAMR